VLIDNKVDRARWATDKGVITLVGDATKDEILKQARVDTAKGLVAAIASDAENVYVALSAKVLNPRLVIAARATDEQSEEKLKRAGATVFFTSHQLVDVDELAGRVAILHDNGIQVNGSFVLGFDHDRPDVFAETAEWIEQNRMECATFHILTPYPGTPLFRQMEAEDVSEVPLVPAVGANEIVHAESRGEHAAAATGSGIGISGRIPTGMRATAVRSNPSLPGGCTPVGHPGGGYVAMR
jgi:hypothetical protein